MELNQPPFEAALQPDESGVLPTNRFAWPELAAHFAATRGLRAVIADDAAPMRIGVGKSGSFDAAVARALAALLPAPASFRAVNPIVLGDINPAASISSTSPLPQSSAPEE